MQSLGISISNGTITLDNVVNDQVYLKDGIDHFRKSTRSRPSENIDEKELTLKNSNELLTGRQRVILMLLRVENFQ